ncbi:histidinol dehydrogenase [Prevotella sp.]|uniref:histidinol dehydrogenase n=1 Tax=Prevotella sp. TaxID=59823 RepID=UPI0025E7E9FA|nr:histidinol dehydrogenase [Prevotella sp.]
MNIIEYPEREQWAEITRRPHIDTTQLYDTVNGVLSDIRANGDTAVMKYEEKFDHARLSGLKVSEEEIKEALDNTPKELVDAIRLAHSNIRKFHQAQAFSGIDTETQPGVRCWQRSMPIDKVGLYIPCGTAPLFSTVLMLATPAVIAGCKDIILCSPPDAEGKINGAILCAAHVAGVKHIYKIGGVQAIGAMAYGTESVPKVYKIFGPGNQYVMAAKQVVSVHDVAIDMPAGPSEVCVVADDTSNPVFVAADLLSQTEHGPDSQVMLISTSRELFHKVEKELASQLAVLPRKEFAEKSLANSKFVLVHDTEEAMAFSNAYAPEHLIISTDDYEPLCDMVRNAGSVFLGKYACESAGDYASGTNHTLPTHGYATAYSGVNLDSFCKKITYQHLSAEGIRSIGHAVELMAENESLFAHKNAMTLRINELNNR